MRIAVIPARGGSKRIPNKNIREFAGKPLLAHSVIAALGSGLFDRVLVSTDSEEIAAVATSWGAEVPFLRSAQLSDDYTGTNAVVADMLCRLQATVDDTQRAISYACCIYATAPLLRSQYLSMGLDLLIERNKQFAFSVCSYPAPIFRALKLGDDQTVDMYWPEHQQTRSQDLPEAYLDAGQFYWGRPEAFIEGRALYGPDTIGVSIPRYLVQDIDTPEDWETAELMYEALRLRDSR
tara:strand:+ start:3716 stop:4426 length:711 start_codon:yes stop_codon:yes gene_type:complete